jgi:ketosteroid isomerase-like protein
MARMSPSVSVLGLVVLAAACASSANVEQEKAALMAADKAALGDIADVDRFLTHWTDDARFAMANMPAVSGKADIRKTMSSMMSAPGFRVTWTPTRAEVSSAGDLGYTVGNYDLTMNNAAGNPASEKGKYLTVWKKQADGSWKIFDDSGSSDTPPAPVSQPHVSSTSAEVKWGDAPPSLPPGAKMAVISGDPTKAEPFTLRGQLPSGYRIPPHWHPTDEHVTVLSGTFAFGMGEKFDEKSLKDLSAGGYTLMTATMPHYGITKGPTVIQVHGMGPFVLNYVNPADDPSRK